MFIHNHYHTGNAGCSGCGGCLSLIGLIVVLLFVGSLCGLLIH